MTEKQTGESPKVDPFRVIHMRAKGYQVWIERRDGGAGAVPAVEIRSGRVKEGE